MMDNVMTPWSIGFGVARPLSLTIPGVRRTTSRFDRRIAQIGTDGTCKLRNKIALITGGTSGIGAATATRFQAECAGVIVTGSDPTTLRLAQEKMPGIEVIASEAAMSPRQRGWSRR
jgi:hypothetical protein